MTLHPAGRREPPLPTASTSANTSRTPIAHREGKRLFGWFNCTGCHANGGGGMGPALMDDEWIYGSEPREHPSRRSSKAGRTACRRSAARIPDDQIWQIAAYVRSLSG